MGSFLGFWVCALLFTAGTRFTFKEASAAQKRLLLSIGAVVAARITLCCCKR